MIKYLGSKRRWTAALADMAVAAEARTAVDLFTGTTRVAHALKQRGIHVTAVDSASYAHVLARCYVATDADHLDTRALERELRRLGRLPGRTGYVAQTFGTQARFFQPHNAERIDAIRDAIEGYAGSALYPVLLTSLMEAADRVDSTTGVQMAYLKQWAPRSFNDLELRLPAVLPGPGRALHGDACLLANTLPATDFAYVDPPYNQHRYESNYHIWETLVRWDAPAHYGTACKRVDLREPGGRSPFNSRRSLPAALRRLVADIDAAVVVVSYHDESWVDRNELTGWLLDAGHRQVAVVEFDAARYVGARIGIHNPRGERVGAVGRTRNKEWMFIAGAPEHVDRVAAVTQQHGATSARLA